MGELNLLMFTILSQGWPTGGPWAAGAPEAIFNAVLLPKPVFLGHLAGTNALVILGYPGMLYSVPWNGHF